MTDATFANPGSVVIDTDTIRTIGILHFTIGVHDHIADAKFIQKCSAVGTWARTSAIPSLQRGGSYFVLAKIRHTLLPSYTSWRPSPRRAKGRSRW